jgi:hypothetical protein
MRLRHRASRLLALLAGAVLVLAALVPYWHGSQCDLVPAGRPSSGDASALHATPPTAAQGDPCPVCAAHRLLDSSSVFEIVPGDAVREDGPVLCQDFDLVVPSPTAPARGRGPPLC